MEGNHCNVLRNLPYQERDQRANAYGMLCVTSQPQRRPRLEWFPIQHQMDPPPPTLPPLRTSHRSAPGAVQVRDDLRRTVLDTAMAAESAKTFKRIMWCNRRPRLRQVFAEELLELDRYACSSSSSSLYGYLLQRQLPYNRTLVVFFFSWACSCATVQH